mgnify:CR=1 FL=1
MDMEIGHSVSPVVAQHNGCSRLLLSQFSLFSEGWLTLLNNLSTTKYKIMYTIRWHHFLLRFILLCLHREPQPKKPRRPLTTGPKPHQLRTQIPNTQSKTTTPNRKPPQRSKNKKKLWRITLGKKYSDKVSLRHKCLLRGYSFIELESYPLISKKGQFQYLLLQFCPNNKLQYHQNSVQCLDF